MMFDAAVGRDQGATGVPARRGRCGPPRSWRKKEEDTLTSFRERVWAGEDARRSIDNGESIHELVVAAGRRTSNPRYQIGCT
jgi:hypothetical protein